MAGLGREKVCLQGSHTFYLDIVLQGGLQLLMDYHVTLVFTLHKGVGFPGLGDGFVLAAVVIFISS